MAIPAIAFVIFLGGILLSECMPHRALSWHGSRLSILALTFACALAIPIAVATNWRSALFRVSLPLGLLSLLLVAIFGVEISRSEHNLCERPGPSDHKRTSSVADDMPAGAVGELGIRLLSGATGVVGLSIATACLGTSIIAGLVARRRRILDSGRSKAVSDGV